MRFAGQYSFEWDTQGVELEDLDEAVLDELFNEGHARMTEMAKQGYTNGELFAVINEVEYTGWWNRSGGYYNE